MSPLASEHITIALAGVVTALALISLLLTMRRLARARRLAEFTELAAHEAKDGLVVQELDGTVLWVNKGYCQMMQRDEAEMIGRNPLSYAMPPHLTPSPEEIAAFDYREVREDLQPLNLRRNVRGNGEEFWNELSVSLHRLPDGRERAVLVCRDATAQVEKETELRAAHAEVDWMARHDPLTGLANRAEFLRVTAAALGGPQPVGVLHIDLDRFKEVNDSLGHAAGDAVICHVADQIAAVARETDLAARLGGDEFVLVCPSVGSLAELKARGEEIAARLTRPLVWEDRKIGCSASMGGALSERSDVSPEELLSRSDVALYDAKRAGRGRVRLYDGEVRRSHAASQARRAALHEAVETGRLSFVYQPTQSLPDGEIRGFETLVRWANGQEGLLAPAEFLGVARELGLMAELDFCAMDAAMRMHARVREATGHALVFGFNASPELLMHPQFFSRLSRGIARYRIPPHLLAIEVLESVFLGDAANPGPFPAVLLDLCRMGYSVLLDDFGTGYAGLCHLARLPVVGVKLDRSLIADLETDPLRIEIVRALHGLAQRIGIHTVAEGIETAATAAALSEIGAFVAQGHWVSQPIPEEGVIGWLEGRDIAHLPHLPIHRRPELDPRRHVT